MEKNKLFFSKKYLFVFIILIFCAVSLSVYLLSVPPKEYMITTENEFDYQKHFECSGYAAAYALRGIGEDITGLELYGRITPKNSDGTVSPDALVGFLQNDGYKLTYRTDSSMSKLKHEVSRGVPVVVLVTTGPGERYYHYIAVVGYDEEKVYASDSLSYKKNSDNQYYNRELSTGDFEVMWNTEYMPRTYIAFDKKQ